MKNIMLLTAAILLTSPIAFGKAKFKLNQPLKSLVEFNVQKMAKKLNSPIEQEPEPVIPPLRTGKVKYTISKGTFSKTEDGWDYVWSNVCVKESPFNVYNADIESFIGGERIVQCQTTLNGRVRQINAVFFGVEGNNVVIDSGEPARRLSAYALYGYIDGQFGEDPIAPELPWQHFASVNRPTSSFLMISRPQSEVTCGETFPPSEPEPSPGPNQTNDDYNCTAKWNEMFRVTAEIED